MVGMLVDGGIGEHGGDGGNMSGRCRRNRVQGSLEHVDGVGNHDG